MSVCQSSSPIRNFLAEINRPLQENFEARFLGGVVKDCCRYFLIIKCEAGGFIKIQYPQQNKTEV